MTLLSTTSTSTRLRRRLLAAALACGSVLALGVDAGANAAPKTASAAVADTADRALDAYAAWEDGRNPADYVGYIRHRDAAATMTAIDLEVDPASLRSEWGAVPAAQQRAVLAAMSQLGVPYKRLASEPGVGFDCSGLTLWAYGQAGIEVPRVSHDQLDASDRIEQTDAAAGDLMHYPGHVGMYLGAGLFIHSPEPGDTVQARHLPDRSLNWGSFGDEGP